MISRQKARLLRLALVEVGCYPMFAPNDIDWQTELEKVTLTPEEWQALINTARLLAQHPPEAARHNWFNLQGG